MNFALITASVSPRLPLAWGLVSSCDITEIKSEPLIAPPLLSLLISPAVLLRPSTSLQI